MVILAPLLLIQFHPTLYMYIGAVHLALEFYVQKQVGVNENYANPDHSQEDETNNYNRQSLHSTHWITDLQVPLHFEASR